MPRKSSKREPANAAERIKRKVEDKERTSPDGTQDARFWKHPEPHLAIFSDGERVSRACRSRRLQDIYHACLYDDDELATLVQTGSAATEFAPQTMSSNIVKRQVDTYVAKITKNRPVPMGLTTNGNYSQQRRAKRLSQTFGGVLDLIDFWPTREQRVRDHAVFGDGFAYNYRVGRDLRHDRFFPWEVEVDPREAQYGKPRTFRLRRYVDKLLLQERYPDLAEAIEASQSKADEDRWAIGWDDTCDLRLVRGVWHLPSAEGANDGWFGLAVSNATLELKQYKRMYPPFSRSTFLPPLVGWRGQGMVKQLAGLQYEVNAIGMRLQESGYMTGSYILVEDGSGIETDVLDNGTLSVVRYRGAKPEWQNPAPWHPALFDYYLNLRGRFAAEESRISELATRGEKPAGLDSGAAQRVYHDIEAEGFLPQGRADERDVVDTCWQHFDLLEEIYADPGEGLEKDKKREPYIIRAETRAHGRSAVEDIDYADVRLDRKQFILRVFPTSFLNGTPEAQLQTVRDMMKDGFLTQDEALTLLDFPDLQRVMNLRGAARRNIERLLEKIKDSTSAEEASKVYEYPEPAWNLELCKALALQAYLDAKLDGVEEYALAKILQFATDAQWQIDNPDQKPQTSIEQESAEQQAAAEVGAIDPSLDPMAAEQVALPNEQPMPANAVAPEVMPTEMGV